jgi:4-hydroxy-2-oxoheptanedioate aldolase
MHNPLKRRLAENQPILGFLVSMPSVQLVQVLARSGVDWLMIDLEHAPIGIESAAAMIAATSGTPATPIVRVPGPFSDRIKPAIDSGAFGIVFPQIATRSEAEATVRAVRYQPQGRRGYGPAYAGLRWGLPSLEYLKVANENLLNIALIESTDGVEALDDILAVDGLDIVAVARGDLSENLGVAGQFDHPRLRDVVARAEAKILKRPGVALGGIAFSPAEAKAMIAAGYRFVVLGGDVGLISNAAGNMVKAVRG